MLVGILKKKITYRLVFLVIQKQAEMSLKGVYCKTMLKKVRQKQNKPLLTV